MLSPTNLLSLALLYICLLFAVAWFTDQRSEAAVHRGPRWRSWIYALSITVYCSSWTFYGAVGSATATPWSHAPIYLGPILMFTLFWPVIRRLLQVGEQHRVTSIADYIGARYGKRQALASIVTLVAAAAVLPYIALQFKALAQAWSIIGGSAVEVEAIGGDTALLTAIILAVFTILFGTRRLDGRERHQGVMTAIAVESLVKLVAFCAVAALAAVYLLRLPDPAPVAPQSLWTLPLTPDFVSQTLISALAVLCPPRQFHAMVVESQGERYVGVARWLFPLYLLLFMVLVVPISRAGSAVFAVSESMNPDTFVQLLPIALDAEWIGVAAFIGGISAATGMVIVATVALAIMITNEVVAPLVMRANAGSPSAVLKLGDSLRRVRQLTIAGIMFAAWLVARWIMDIPWLTQIGFICFLAAAQLAPPLLAGLYWRVAHGRAVLIGLVLGLLTWFYCAVLPAVLPAEQGLLAAGPFGIGWLAPGNLLGSGGNSPLAYATLWSLGLNLGSLVVFSLLLNATPADERQARLFMTGPTSPGSAEEDFSLSLIRVSQLQSLLPPFVEEAELRRMWGEFEDRYQQRLLPGDRAPQFVVNRVEAVLAAMIGATSAHQAMEQLEQSQQLAYSDLAGMVSDASKLNTFNRELLQTTVESLLQGVSVVDGDLRLVAWNKRYEELFGYPERFLYVGCPIERVYRFNAERGILGSSGLPVDEEISKRLQWLREGNPHRLERTLPDGKVIDIRGTPMPHGGFVTTYIDITDYREVVAQLEEAKQELEQKVASGSRSLSETNAELRRENRLRASMEAQLRDANQSKSRFMSATSHDLLQPINAARLFTSVLQRKLDTGADATVLDNVRQIDGSLKRAEQLISELREIARLDSGREQAHPGDFSAAELLSELESEFLPLARAHGLELHCVTSSLWLHTDRSLLYRMVQNLLSNAINYTASGRVLLGIRRRGEHAELQVLDTGPGIAEVDRVRIFEEFERLPRQSGDAGEGLGLGLAIVRRYAEMLDLELGLRSRERRGTRFSVRVPLGRPTAAEAADEERQGQSLAGLPVWCLDNDAQVRSGMQALLDSMGAEVTTLASGRELHALLARGPRPVVILADYHLDDDENGVDVVLSAQASVQSEIPCIVISADNSMEVRDKVAAAGFRFLPKPVHAARLQALVAALAE